MYLYQGLQIPFINYFRLPYCNNPPLTRTLSRVKVGSMGRHSVTLLHNLSVTTTQIFLLGVHNLNNMAARIPTRVPTS